MKVKLEPWAIKPERAHGVDAGLDLFSPVDAYIEAGGSATIDTGVHVEIPFSCAGFLKSKSGLNVKYGIISEGVIDTGYTGSIVVKLYNIGKKDYAVMKGDKISQLVVMLIALPDIELVDSMEETERGENGFGSTGK